MDRKLISLNAKIELARREFFFYCHLKAPSFYREDRAYLIDFCNQMQTFYESDEEVLVVNLPPRHGKSRTAGLFVEWALGKNRKVKIMTGSYNEMLSTSFSKQVRNNISELKADPYKAVYSDIFPDITIKKGDAAMNLWSLEGGYNNYLATSPGGTATGFGCDLLIVDDLIRNVEEANNENTLEKHWEWFANTMLSRLEEGGKIIVIMTRWATKDLAGKVLEHYTNQGAKIRHITMKALQDDGSMLCSEVLSYKSYQAKIKAMGADIASANFQQIPIDIKGRLYSSFKTYAKLPVDDEGKSLITQVRNYTDTADTGDEFLCSINYAIYEKEAYVLDILYSKKSMEFTEPEVAKMLHKDNVNIADIESNNGGRGFGRSVERILKEWHGSNRTYFNLFHQSKNKIARIISNSTWVMNHVYFPVNWRDRWPEYYDAMLKYQKEGKNKYDDAPDATTGIAEKIGAGSVFSF